MNLRISHVSAAFLIVFAGVWFASASPAHAQWGVFTKIKNAWDKVSKVKTVKDGGPGAMERRAMRLRLESAIAGADSEIKSLESQIRDDLGFWDLDQVQNFVEPSDEDRRFLQTFLGERGASNESKQVYRRAMDRIHRHLENRDILSRFLDHALNQWRIHGLKGPLDWISPLPLPGYEDGLDLTSVEIILRDYEPKNSDDKVAGSDKSEPHVSGGEITPEMVQKATEEGKKRREEEKKNGGNTTIADEMRSLDPRAGSLSDFDVPAAGDSVAAVSYAAPSEFDSSSIAGRSPSSGPDLSGVSFDGSHGKEIPSHATYRQLGDKIARQLQLKEEAERKRQQQIAAARRRQQQQAAAAARPTVAYSQPRQTYTPQRTVYRSYPSYPSSGGYSYGYGNGYNRAAAATAVAGQILRAIQQGGSYGSGGYSSGGHHGAVIRAH